MKTDFTMDCHAVQAPLAMTEKRGFFKQDSRACGGALQALKILGKVSDLCRSCLSQIF